MEISIHGVERKVHEFGDAVAALAGLSGTSEVSAAIQSCNFLAALAGPRGGLVGLGGEVHPIGTSMISLGADSPAQARLTELLISPLRYLQEDLIEYNRRVDPGWLSRMSTMLVDPNLHGHGERRPVREEERAEAELRHVAGRAEKSAQVVSESHPLDRRAAFRRERELSDEEHNARAMFAAMSPLAKVDYEGMIPFNEARCLREPLVLLESPDAKVLLHGMGQVDRQSPLVIDADGRLLGGIFGKPRHKAAEVIEGFLTGRCTRAVGGGGVSPGRGVLLSVIDRDRLAGWLAGSGTNGHLCRALLAEPGQTAGAIEGPYDLGSIERGYAHYRQTVRSVLRLRRLDAPGVAPILEPPVALEFFRRQREFQNRIDEVESYLKSFAASFIYLPATALWSLQHLSAASDDRELVPRAFHLAEEAMRMHLGLMKQGLEAGQLQSMEEDGLNMLRKLAQSEPCRIRDLLRRYDIQRKSLHEPVLEHLIETNRVRRVQKGLLQLTEQGRHELEAMKVN